MSCNKYDTLELMAFISNDLSEQVVVEVQSHLESCAECSRQVFALKKEKAAFLKKYPSPDYCMKKESSKIAFFRTRSFLAAAASLIIIIAGGYVTLSTMKSDDFRIKGTTEIDLYVLDSTGIPKKRSDSLYYPDEKIQFTYSTGKKHFLILVSVDSNHTITTYYPSKQDSSILLKTGRNLPLPHSITLDSYTGKELYIAIFTAFPLHLGYVKQVINSSLMQQRELFDLQFNIDNADVRFAAIYKAERLK